ncbi:MAG TPA: hypothetical protein VGU90_18225 [Terriglobales bacterium]|nr:hypothetical protein [Terriglobales bacterium]
MRNKATGSLIEIAAAAIAGQLLAASSRADQVTGHKLAGNGRWAAPSLAVRVIR